MSDQTTSTPTANPYIADLQRLLDEKEPTCYSSTSGRSLQISVTGFTFKPTDVPDVLDSEYARLSFNEAAMNARMTVRFHHDSLNAPSERGDMFEYVCGTYDDLSEGQRFVVRVKDKGPA